MRHEGRLEGKLEGKTALITGAGRGIGRAIALGFAAQGARLALAARTSGELEETARQISENNGEPARETLVIPVDVTDETGVEDMVKQTLDRFGGIDILVNNAGIGGPVGVMQDNDVDSWIQTMQVNVIGLYLCSRAVIPAMVRNGGGKIVNLAGAGANNGWAYLSAYCASKAAVVRLTEVLSLELAEQNIQVNALGPGSIDTQMWQELRDGAAEVNATEIYELGQRVTSGGGASLEDTVALAVFLAGDDSGALNGRLISAVADDFTNLAPQIPEIMASDTYTLRRVDLRSQQG
jgi:NAD(P)-dependent dehydrogenase (short-subunit alcohol dehydrogenase family)